MCDVITDIIYLLDSFFCSRTGESRSRFWSNWNLLLAIPGYLEQGLLVRDVRKVTRRYWRSPQRNWDIASCIPLDYIWELAFRSPKPVLRFNRLIRLERVQSFLNTTETRSVWICVFSIFCTFRKWKYVKQSFFKDWSFYKMHFQFSLYFSESPFQMRSEWAASCFISLYWFIGMLVSTFLCPTL